MVRGRCHDDQQASVSVSPGNGAGHLVKCFAGCSAEEVLDAAGLTFADILPARDPEPRNPKPKIPLTSRKPETAPAAQKAEARTIPQGEIIRHEIRDADGTLAAVHCRQGSGTGKRVWWETSEGKSGLGGRKVTELPLFGAHLLPDDKTIPIILCEGEKAADVLIRAGIPAVGTVCGASSAPSDGSLHPLIGRPVYLWPDNDDPGRQHMARIAEALTRLGCHGIRVIDWKNAGDKEDAADLLAMEGWRDDFDVLLDEARLLEATTAPDVTPDKEAPPKPKPLLVNLEEFQALGSVATKWTVGGLLPSGAVGAIVGESTAGKSFVLIDMACCIASGVPFNDKVVMQGPVIILLGEGHEGVRKRILAWEIEHGVKIPKENLYLTRVRPELDERTLAGLEAELADKGIKPVLIIADTLSATFPSGKDEAKPGDMVGYFNGLARLRDRLNPDCAILASHHPGHGDKKRGRGSSAFRGLLDVEFLIAHDGSGVRTLQAVKLKDMDLNAVPVETFALKPVPVEVVGDEIIRSAVVQWRGPTAKPKKAVKLSDNEKLAKDALKGLTVDTGTSQAGLETWRMEFYRVHIGDTPDEKRNAFWRARAGLAKKGLVVADNDRYSLSNGGIKE